MADLMYERIGIHTRYVHVRNFYEKQENTFYIVGWEPEDLGGRGQTLAVVKADSQTNVTFEWLVQEASFDELASVKFCKAVRGLRALQDGDTLMCRVQSDNTFEWYLQEYCEETKAC